MKTALKALTIPLLILALAGCGGVAPESQPAQPAPSTQPVAETEPTPPPFDAKYENRVISVDGYEVVKEIAYISPLDGKRIICTIYENYSGAGNSCREAAL